MPLITKAQLSVVAPKGDPKLISAIVDHADDVLPRYGLATAARLTDFMAHVLVESAYLTTAAENLNYNATRLMEVWPSRFPTLGSTSGFAHVPEALACKVYGGRMGNNNAKDGWTYRGQGLLQITGKDNFQRLATKLGRTIDITMALVTSPEGMLECAAAVYVMLGAPAYADKGDIVGSTRAINGGTNGLADRKAMLAKCQKLWPIVAVPSASAIHVDTDKPVLASIEKALNAAAVSKGAVGAVVLPKPPLPVKPPVTAPPHILPAAPTSFWARFMAALTGKA